MIIKRLLILQAILLVGMSLIFVLPHHLDTQPPGVAQELPDFLGDWYGSDLMVTEKERIVLGPTTSFARKRYTNGLGDFVDVSIVYSGEDMNNSIHRPERCLPAQGYTIVESGVLKVPVQPQPLSITRLHNSRDLPVPDGAKPTKEYNLSYYWFIGCSETTPSHFSREIIDIRDRLFKGFVQRWAYITVSATITKDLKPFGRSQPETDTMIQDFIKQLVPQIEKSTVVNS